MTITFDEWLVETFTSWCEGEFSWDVFDAADRPPRTLGNHLWGAARTGPCQQYLKEHPARDPRYDDRHIYYWLAWMREEWTA